MLADMTQANLEVFLHIWAHPYMFLFFGQEHASDNYWFKEDKKHVEKFWTQPEAWIHPNKLLNLQPTAKLSQTIRRHVSKK